MGKKKYVRTTAMPLKVSIKCEPVAWAGEKILKYRAAVACSYIKVSVRVFIF